MTIVGTMLVPTGAIWHRVVPSWHPEVLTGFATCQGAESARQLVLFIVSVRLTSVMRRRRRLQPVGLAVSHRMMQGHVTLHHPRIRPISSRV